MFVLLDCFFFFFSSRRRHTRYWRDWSSDVCSSDLAFGLACTWLVGVGRYWDNPRASLLQHLGVGSVVYVFALALLLWLRSEERRVGKECRSRWSPYH